MVALAQTAEAKEVFMNEQKFDAGTKSLNTKRPKRAGSFAPSCFTRRQKALQNPNSSNYSLNQVTASSCFEMFLDKSS